MSNTAFSLRTKGWGRVRKEGIIVCYPGVWYLLVKQVTEAAKRSVKGNEQNLVYNREKASFWREKNSSELDRGINFQNALEM